MKSIRSCGNKGLRYETSSHVQSIVEKAYVKEWSVPRRTACGNNHTSFNRVHIFLRGIDGDEMHASSIDNANRTGNQVTSYM